MLPLPIHPVATGVLAPKQSSKPPEIEIQNTLNQWSFCQILECQAPYTNVKHPNGDSLVKVLYQYLAMCDNPR